MNFWIRSLAGLSFTLLSAAAIACGDGDSGDDEGSGGGSGDDSETELEPGYTDCDGDVCNPGTYCDTYSACQTGCTSEANCTEEEDCVKGEGSTVGSCMSQSSGPGGGSNSCDRMGSFDGECEAAGLPSAAYRCTASAPADCQLHPDQATYPGGYCCES